MPFPSTLRVKLSTEAAGSISITPVVVREMTVPELIGEMLPHTGKDAARIRDFLSHGTLVAGGTRFRWTGFEADAQDVIALVSAYPDPDPSRRFDRARCHAVVLEVGRRRIELTREAGSRRRFLRKSSYWDALMHAAEGNSLEYRGYDYRRSADWYAVKFAPSATSELQAAAHLLADAFLRGRLAAEPPTHAELFARR